MSISESHSAGMKALQNLVTSRKVKSGERQIKMLLITYPKDAKDLRYRNKRFYIECISSSIEEGRMKSNDSTYSSEDVKMTLLYDDMDKAIDVKNTIGCPNKDFKQNNVKIKYDSKTYVVSEETANEFETAINLYCELKV